MKCSQGPTLTKLFKLPFLLRTTATHVTQSHDFPHCCCNAAYLQKTEKEAVMALTEFSVFGITSIVIHTVSHFRKRIHRGIIYFILPQFSREILPVKSIWLNRWRCEKSHRAIITRGQTCGLLSGFNNIQTPRGHCYGGSVSWVSGPCAFLQRPLGYLQHLDMWRSQA